MVMLVLSVYLGLFAMPSVMYIKYTPSSHVENRLELYEVSRRADFRL